MDIKREIEIKDEPFKNNEDIGHPVEKVSGLIEEVQESNCFRSIYVKNETEIKYEPFDVVEEVSEVCQFDEKFSGNKSQNLDLDEDHEEKSTYEDVLKICEDKITLLAFLQESGLILSAKECEKCSKRCKLIKKKEKYYFRCMKCCCFYSTTPKNFFLHRSKLSYETVLKLMFHFLNGTTANDVRNFVDINQKGIIEWYRLFREVCLAECFSSDRQIGGDGKIVEVDDSMFGKRKCNRGRFTSGLWVFGGVERGSNDCFIVPVKKKDNKTIMDIIKKKIKPGTTIISDCWKGYKDLSKSDFEHLTENYSIHFVDPNTGTHTNTIEEFWEKVKANIPSSGRRKEYFPDYIATYIWRRENKEKDMFSEFLKSIKKHYYY